MAIVVERFEERGGGVEAAAFHLVRELAARDVAVSVVCRVAPARPPSGATLVELRVSPTWQPLRLLRFSRQATAATARGFDLVHAYARTRHQTLYRCGGGCHAEYMERVYRRPQLRRLSPRHRAILAIEEAVFRDPAQWIECNSHHAARTVASRYAVPTRRLSVIYNGVDTERFHPRRRRQHRERLRASLGLRGPTALFVGDAFVRKGLDRAIRGLAAGPPDAQLLVAGAGDVARFRALAHGRGVEDRVRFLGRRPDVEVLHAAADLLVLPTRYDPFANACLEAMASGLPVATTPHNGVSELLEGGDAGLVIEGDFRAAFELLADAARLAARGEAARAIAEAHSWRHHADETLALYERVLA
ncbi:MAG: glycosyltransferase family 4 protein [Myxococcota bacterium]